MMSREPREWVYIVEDDSSVRSAMAGLLEGEAREVVQCESGEVFLAHWTRGTIACVLLDLSLGAVSGLDVLEAMPPDDPASVVVLTGRASVASAVRAFKDGAFEFLEKPPDNEHLCSVVRRAFERSRHEVDRLQRALPIRERFDTLTEAERVVLGLIVAGLSSGEIGRHLHRSQRTIGNHRLRLLRKMDARNTAELVRLALLAGLDPWGGAPNGGSVASRPPGARLW